MTPDSTFVYEALTEDIKRLGVTSVFGLMSDDTAIFVSALDAAGIRFYGSRHENTAGAMADGYAAATGQLGIAILGRGPATANALHGAIFAQRTGSRVLLVFGEGATTLAEPNGLGPDLKTFAGKAVLEAAGLRTFVAQHAESARQTFADAVAATVQGAVALLLPTNVQLSKMPSVSEPLAGPRAERPPMRPRSAAIKTAADVLVRSKRPLIIAGRGAHLAGARAVIEQLAERTGAVVATTLKARDMFKGYRYNTGVIGSFSHAAGRRYIEQADCVLAVGAGLNLRTTSYGDAFSSDAPVIQVEVDRSHIGRWCHADVAVVGDAKLAIDELLAVLPGRSASDKPFHVEETWLRLAEHDPSSEFEPMHTPRTVDPRSLAIALDRLLPEQRNVVYDVGNFFQVAGLVSVPGPGHFKLSSDFASIGMGFGAALGFAVGQPTCPTVVFMGDGSFAMNMGELETVAREDIPLVIVLMNDCAYGAERHFLQMRNVAIEKSIFPDVDYAPVAEAFGFTAATVRTLEQLTALAPMLRDPQGPILLDCKINGDVVAPFLVESLVHLKPTK
jgi:acetolactate synthase I/II/III large subunit